MPSNPWVPLLPPALLVVLSIGGCVSGPDYKRPDVDIAPKFRSQVSPAEARSIADLSWWQLFNDKVLNKLITQALTGNYDLQVAVAHIEQARALAGVARADYYPQIGYEGGVARQQTFVPFELFTRNPTYNSFGINLSAAWELDLWGRIRRSNEAARANLYAQEDVRRGVMLTLVANVASSYFALLELDSELAIARDSAEAFRRTLDLFNQRFQAGQESKLGVDRAQATYDASNASIARLTRAISQQENALCVLLGIYPRDIERGAPLAEQVMPEAPPGATTDIIRRRPDIQQAEHVMIGANAEIGVAVANFFPQVGLSALFGTQTPRIDNIFDSNFQVWSIAAGVAGPIFNGGRLRQSYRAQKAFWEATIAQYRRTVLTAFQETSDALIAQHTLVAQRAAQQSQVAALREAVNLSLVRYDSGRASYFEVLEAQQQLFPAESALSQTQRDQLLATVNLYKALGGGWNVPEADWNHPD